jgi:hypothetical protein
VVQPLHFRPAEQSTAVRATTSHSRITGSLPDRARR